MKVKSSVLLLSTVTMLAFSNSVVHADSSWESKISQLERQKEEIAKKNGVTSYASDGRWYSLVESENKIKELEANLNQLKTPYSEKNTIKVSSEYVQALKDYYNYKKSDSERDRAEAILKAESKKLRLQEDKFISNVVDQVEVYDVNDLPKDVKIELNYFALNMLNQVRKQMGLPQLTLANSSIDFADKLSKKVREADRSVFDWHYVKGINDIAREYGLPTSSKEDEERETGGQFYENSFALSGVTSDMTKADMKKWIYYSIVEFLYNGSEFSHAQSIAGINYGKSYKNEYLGISLHYLKDGLGISYITVSDNELSKANKSTFKKDSPLNTTENNRKSLLSIKEKELQTEKGKYEKIKAAYDSYDSIDKKIKEEKEKEKKEKEKREGQDKKNSVPVKPSKPAIQNKEKSNDSSKKKVNPVIEKNGWKKENGYWYYYKNGNRVTNSWQGSYYLKSDGKMADNEWIYDSYYSSWFYLKSGGAYINSAWYYDSYYQSWYYFKSGGYMAKNSWQGSYYLKSSGAMAKNEWVYDSYYGGWYYLKNSGVYARSEWIQGRYWVDYSGRWV